MPAGRILILSSVPYPVRTNYHSYIRNSFGALDIFLNESFLTVDMYASTCYSTGNPFQAIPIMYQYIVHIRHCSIMSVSDGTPMCFARTCNNSTLFAHDNC